MAAIKYKDFRFVAICAHCGAEVEVSPNSRYEWGVEGDFWCCGSRQWESWEFAEGHDWIDPAF